MLPRKQADSLQIQPDEGTRLFLPQWFPLHAARYDVMPHTATEKMTRPGSQARPMLRFTIPSQAAWVQYKIAHKENALLSMEMEYDFTELDDIESS